MTSGGGTANAASVPHGSIGQTHAGDFDWARLNRPSSTPVEPAPTLKSIPFRISDHSSMIASIKDFFSQFIEPGIASPTSENLPTMQIATAALLIEMMRIDRNSRMRSDRPSPSTLQTRFNLDTTQFETLIALAEREARNATDYYQFTSLINKHCDLGQKVQIIENLWHVAMIDGHLDAHELHLMRKLADLLYVGHGDYVAAREATGARLGKTAGLIKFTAHVAFADIETTSD